MLTTWDFLGYLLGDLLWGVSGGAWGIGAAGIGVLPDAALM